MKIEKLNNNNNNNNNNNSNAQQNSSKGKRSAKKRSFGENIAQLKNAVYDPSGSYTGVPEDRDKNPVQDADDL